MQSIFALVLVKKEKFSCRRLWSCIRAHHHVLQWLTYLRVISLTHYGQLFLKMSSTSYEIGASFTWLHESKTNKTSLFFLRFYCHFLGKHCIINLCLLIWALKRIIGFWLVLFCNVSKFKHASNRRHRGGSPIEFESKQVIYVVIWSSRFFQSVPRKVECNPFDVFGIIELAPFIATVNHIVSSHKQCKQIYIMEDIKPTLNPVKRECQSYFTTTKRW